MQKDNEKLIKSTNVLPTDDQKLLKERFISEYARKKGWDKTNLSPDQLKSLNHLYNSEHLKCAKCPWGVTSPNPKPFPASLCFCAYFCK